MDKIHNSYCWDIIIDNRRQLPVGCNCRLVSSGLADMSQCQVSAGNICRQIQQDIAADRPQQLTGNSASQLADRHLRDQTADM